jgi:hypothetical protein
MKKQILIILLFILLSSFSKSQNTSKNHVFEPERFRVLRDTQTLTGTILKINQELDGDMHIQLRMNCNCVELSPRNYTKQDSCIVLEIVCAHKPKIPLICACKDYVNEISIPIVGNEIIVTGQLVFDKIHRWTEIHPVYNWSYQFEVAK